MKKYFSGLILGSFLLSFSGCNTPNIALPTNRTQQDTPVVSLDSSQPKSRIKEFSLNIKRKKLISGSTVLQVTEGDEVVIKITSDQPDELHLHGYDLSVEIEKNKTAQLSFTAKVSGRFTYELEKSGTELGALEVLPQ